MKSKNFLTAIALMTTLNVYAAGGDVGNGGSGDESQLAAQQAELESISSKLRIFFLKNKSKLQSEFPEFEIQNLAERIEAANIRVVDEGKLLDRHGINRTCLNYASSNLIECSFKELQAIKEPKTLFVLMLHEYLGLLGVEETSPQNSQTIDGYSISKRIAPYVTKVSDYDLKLTEDNNPNCNTNNVRFVMDANTSEFKYEIEKQVAYIHESGNGKNITICTGLNKYFSYILYLHPTIGKIMYDGFIKNINFTEGETVVYESKTLFGSVYNVGKVFWSDSRLKKLAIGNETSYKVVPHYYAAKLLTTKCHYNKVCMDQNAVHKGKSKVFVKQIFENGRAIVTRNNKIKKEIVSVFDLTPL